MITVQDVCGFLDEFAPEALAESWDNTGLLLGYGKGEVTRLLTCLTLTPDVAAEAISEKYHLIVTHHPILFRSRKQLTDADAEGRMVLDLIRAGIAVYSPHTRYDSADDGINQQLATDFGLIRIEPLRPSVDGESTGSGRFGRLEPPAQFKDFLRTVANSVRADSLEFAGNTTNPVQIVAVACGSASEFLEDAIRLGCDTFVTGEARFHSALEARTRGLRLILTGHFCSERPAVEELARVLAARFPGVHSRPSHQESNPLQLFRMDHDAPLH